MLSLVLLLASDCKHKKDQPTTPDAKPQTLCPVMDQPIDKQFHADYKSKRIYFCHQVCVDAFKADPEKYMKILRESGVTLEDAPPSAPEHSGEGSPPAEAAP
jgi:YHS domain-containing protein